MSKSYKIVVHVPVDATERVLQAMGDAGAGKIGNYSHCSFSSRGIGRFLPEKGAQPTIGAVGHFEQVDEERVEMTCQQTELTAVIKALKQTHPYEEPTYDIYERIDL